MATPNLSRQPDDVVLVEYDRESALDGQHTAAGFVHRSDGVDADRWHVESQGPAAVWRLSRR